MNRQPSYPRAGAPPAPLPRAWDGAAEKDTAPKPTTEHPIILYFWAPWCAYCRALRPQVERMAGTFAGRVDLRPVQVDREPETARQYAVQAVPTWVVIHGEQEVFRHVGALGPEGLSAVFEGALQGRRPAHLAWGQRVLWLAAGLSLLALGSLSHSPVLIALGALLILAAALQQHRPSASKLG